MRPVKGSRVIRCRPVKHLEFGDPLLQFRLFASTTSHVGVAYQKGCLVVLWAIASGAIKRPMHGKLFHSDFHKCGFKGGFGEYQKSFERTNASIGACFSLDTWNEETSHCLDG